MRARQEGLQKRRWRVGVSKKEAKLPFLRRGCLDSNFLHSRQAVFYIRESAGVCIAYCHQVDDHCLAG